MSKFTPGPWFSDSFGNIWRRNPAELYQNGGGVAGDKPIAIVYKGWHRENENGYPVEANAALIADAPALLEALQTLLIAMEDLQFDYNTNSGSEAMSQARALIAKHGGVV